MTGCTYTANRWSNKIATNFCVTGRRRLGKSLVRKWRHSDDIIYVEDLDSKEHHIMIFDDVMLEKQGPIETYFSRGRHGGADFYYLSQN